ncbi:MAG: serine/threonine protein kinase [Deltaproteobacteria bacterium]|nr:serine/threonine protein kinase [Deltaproteobacteria bacterium]
METTRTAATQPLRFVCEQCRTAYAARLARGRQGVPLPALRPRHPLPRTSHGRRPRCARRRLDPRHSRVGRPGHGGGERRGCAREVTPPVGAPPHLSTINLDPADDSAFINIPDDPGAAVSFDDPPRAGDPPSSVPPPESRDWLMSSFDQDERPTAPADSIPRPAAHTTAPDRGLPTLASGITPLVPPRPVAEPPPAPSPVTPPARRTFGPYEIVAEIGRGGMGIVYKARDPKLDRFVAIKTLIGGHASNQSAIKRFEREARTIARLAHPAIVPIHEYGEIDGTRYLVMEFVEGRTLVDLAKGERGNTRASLMLMSKVARALAYAHAQGVVHRDLKPANIMVDARREPRVMDFGLAKDLDSSQSMLSQTGDLMGTPNYMAPEQADGRIHEVDQLSDVFSMGAILYELLTGSPPFHGASLAETLRQVLFEDPPPMRTLNPKLDPELERITLKALEKVRDSRYASAAALADDLERFLQGQEISVAPPSVLTRVTRTVRRKRSWARGAAIAVLALAAIAGGTAFFLRDPLGGIRERLSSHDAEVRQRAIETLATDRKAGRLGEAKRAPRRPSRS